MNGAIKRILGCSGLGLMVSLSSQAFAAGYKMEFQSPSVLADAGEAAVVEDAGTNWYNSAGLVYLPQQLVASAIDVYAPTTFGGTMTAPSTLPPPVTVFGSPFAASGSVSSHPNSIIPAIHYALPFNYANKCFAFGLSVVPAWGFTEDYGEHSKLRYNLTRVYTKTLDIAPSIAMRFNDQWSGGIGPDFHYFSVESRAHVRTEGLPPFGTAGDSVSRFSANRWGFGGHVGLLYRITDATRVGINYRTRIQMNLDGYSDFVLNGGPSFEDGSFKLDIPLPPITTLSVYHDVTPCWALMGTIAYDQWSVLRNYHAHNYIQPPSPSNPSGVLPDVVSPQHMSNTIDYSIGTHVKLNECWMLRASIKYEATPTNSNYRGVEFPDGNKLGINLGAHYQINQKLGVDGIYAHVFTKTMHINNVNPATFAFASGHQTTSVDLLGAQLVWNI